MLAENEYKNAKSIRNNNLNMHITCNQTFVDKGNYYSKDFLDSE